MNLVTFLPFKPSEIIPDGLYWVVTKKKYGYNYISANLKRVGDKMTADVTRQTVIFRSALPASKYIHSDTTAVV